MELIKAKPFVFPHDHEDAHAFFDAGFRAGTLREGISIGEDKPDLDDAYGYLVSDFKGSRHLVRRQLAELAAFSDEDYPEMDDIDHPLVLPNYYAAGLLYGSGQDPRNHQDTMEQCTESLSKEIAVMQLRRAVMDDDDDDDIEANMQSIPPSERMTVLARLLEEPEFVPHMAMFRAADPLDVRLHEVFASVMNSGRMAVTWESLLGDDVVMDSSIVIAAVARNNGLEVSPDDLKSVLPERLRDEFADCLIMAPPWRDALVAYRWHPLFTAKVLPRWLNAGMTPDLTGLESLFVDPYAIPSTARRAFAQSVDAALGVLPDLLLNGASAKAVYDATKRDPRAREIVRKFLMIRHRALAEIGLPVELAMKVLKLQGHRWPGVM